MSSYASKESPDRKSRRKLWMAARLRIARASICRAYTSICPMSEADEQDILFGIKHGFDIIAASFVRNADDLLQLREFLDQNGGGHIKVIAKIENAEGVENAGEIIPKLRWNHGCTGGDMGVEIPLEEVPVQQKKLIKRGYLAGKQVITATQMLESMITHPRPTRAEGTDGQCHLRWHQHIMLSGETAAGKYPVKAVETMARIALRTEQDIDYKKRFLRRASATMAQKIRRMPSPMPPARFPDLNAAALLAITKTGTTAKLISKFRPSVPIIGGAMTDEVMRQLNSLGMCFIRLDEKMNMDELLPMQSSRLWKQATCTGGELVIITAGIPLGVAGRII